MVVPVPGTSESVDIIVDQLKMLVSQEKRYQVTDYLHTRAATSDTNISSSTTRKTCSTNTSTDHRPSSSSSSSSPSSTTKDDDGSAAGSAKNLVDPHPYDECMRIDCNEVDVDEDDDIMHRDRLLSDFQKQRIHWREKICEWCYQVVDHFDLSRECVYVAMHYVDRYTSKMERLALSGASKDDFQLLSMAALGLALKLFDHRNILVPGAASSVETILLLSRGKFVLSQLEQMEMELLTRLEWLSHPPTPQTFVGHVLRAYFPSSSSCTAVRDVAHFCIELTVLDYYFVPYNPSEVAIASLLQAVKTVLATPAPLDGGMSGGTDSSIQTLRARLEPLVTDRINCCYARLGRLYTSSVGDDNNIIDDEEEEERSYSPVSVSSFDHVVSYSNTTHQC